MRDRHYYVRYLFAGGYAGITKVLLVAGKSVALNSTIRKMRKISVLALATLLLATTFAGCSSDNDDVSGLTPDCAITAVVLGTLYRDYHTNLSDGRDTSYTITLPGSTFPMHINQLSNEVFNTDSLPLGTRTDKVVLTTLTTDGTVLLRSLSGSDTLYSTKDTLDFTSPRTFTVYAADGTGSRSYTIKVNVHQTDPEAYTWIADGETNARIAAMSDMKMLSDGEMLRLWGITNGETVMMSRLAEAGAEWTCVTTAGTDSMNVQSITKYDGAYFATAAQGLIRSIDGITWESTGANIVPANIISANETAIYASTTDGVYKSSDGVAWENDVIDASASLLPQQNVVATVMPLLTNPKIENIVTVGYIDTVSVVWKKEIDLTGTETNAWSYYPYTEENSKSLPFMQGMCLIKYENDLYAVGIRNGTPSVYISEDGARTWLLSDVRTILPASLGTPSEMTMTVDSDNTIWLAAATTGQVWRGYLNRLKASAGE